MPIQEKIDDAVELTLRTAGAVTAAETVTETAVSITSGARRAEIVCELTAAATEAGDTLDVYVDTYIAGTWVNVVHFAQMLGNGGAKTFVAQIIPEASVATAPIDVTSSAAAGAIRHLLGTQFRVRRVTVDVATLANISFTFGVKARVWP
jgi:hypothetical protein